VLKPRTETALAADTGLRKPSPAIAAITSAANSPGRKVSRDTLINQFNCLHFQDGQVIVVLEHSRHGRLLRLPAEPNPCFDEFLVCRWAAPLPCSTTPRDYRFRHLEISGGNHQLRVELQEAWFDETELHGRLPEIGLKLAARRTKRHYCSGINAQIVQNGAVFDGVLVDFSAKAFRLDLKAAPPQTFQWLTDDEPITVLLSRNGKTMLGTAAQILRRHGGQLEQSIVVRPTRDVQRRYPAKQHRALRQQLKPNPTVQFTHPLTAQRLCLNVLDISGAGFAVIESAGEASLVPGMIIEGLDLNLAGGMHLNCTAQVVYRREVPEAPGRDTVCCGLALLDMTISEHNRLMNLLNQAEDRRHFACSNIDMDQLWTFFFQSGFIYPQKYKAIEGNRQALKEAYARLYSGAPEIARHFVYQEHNAILGHMAMLRLFSGAWMIHHHAADRSRSRHAGLDTLRMAGEAANVAQALYSSHMQYAFSYYRPENRFPHRVFGGVADHYADPRQCSVDSFAYCHYRKEFDLNWKDSGPWTLTPAHREELAELEAWHAAHSGSLMLKALDLTVDAPAGQQLAEVYREAGFQWERLVFSLQRDGVTTAIFMVLRTELGLNFSSFNNAITVLVTDPERLPREAFYTAISMLASKYPQNEVPVLVYPESYAREQHLDVEKNYNLWVIDCHNLDPYFDFCDKLFRRLKRTSEGEP